MGIHYASPTPLSEDARALVEFDRESIQQLVRARREPDPDIWLVDPEGYEGDGHVQRDSESIRLVAYSRAAHAIYATDGCNACRHLLETDLESSTKNELASVSRYTQLPARMLERLQEQARSR